MSKTGTTIVASVVQKSLLHARLLVEPRTVALLEKLGRHAVPWVVKILYEHWQRRPFLLEGIVRGETGFSPDKAVAIVRDPRDGLVSAVMYRAYECVQEGASERSVQEWVEIVRGKEADPRQYSLLALMAHFSRIFHVDLTPDSFFATFVDYSRWIVRNRDRFHVLKYEDFVAGSTSALSAYLGIALSESRDVDPSLGRVARTRRSGGWRAVMLPEDASYLRQRYGAALEERGYGDWELRPGTLDPEEGSAYITKITSEAFRSARQKRASELTAPQNR
jgi:hypothetical protein